MPNIDQQAKDWQLEWAARIGKAVQARRKELDLTASDLALRTKQLGYPMTRSTIARIENNHRAGKMDVAEVAVLAMALGIPPVMLLYPGLPHTSYRYLPTGQHYAIEALRWFTGESGSYFAENVGVKGEDIESAIQPLALSRQFHRAELARRHALSAAKLAEGKADHDEAQNQRRYAQEQVEIRDQILSVMRTLGLPISSEYPDEAPADA